VNLAKDQLEQALRLVQQGILQPDEAARWLLGQSDPPPDTRPPTSSISALLNRLGPPPPAIQQDWDRQLARLNTQYERLHGNPLPELSADDIHVDAENRIYLPPDLSAGLTANAVSPASSFSPANPTAAANSDSPLERVQMQFKDAPQKRSESPTSSSSPAQKKKLADQYRWLVPGSVFAFAAAALGTTFYLFGSKPPDAIEVTQATTSNNASIFSPTATPPITPPPQASKASSESSNKVPSDFSFAESNVTEFPSTSPVPTGPTSQAPSPAEKESKASLGLDSFAGGNWVTASDLLPEADFDASGIAPDEMSTDEMSADEDDTEALPPGVDTESSSSSSMAESSLEDEQDNETSPDYPTTNTDSKTAIELPPLPSRATPAESISAVPLIEQAPDIHNVELHFPVETGLSLTRADQRWQIRDTKDQSVVAVLESEDEVLRFRWTPESATHSSAKQLASGLLTCSFDNRPQQTFYLRPLVTAEPWPLDLDKVDSRASWPIAVAPPTGISNLSIAFKVPESVLQSWVQAPDAKQLRRNQSIIEFKLDKDPTIAIRSRLEIRTGTRVSLRIRHAAQLDPSLPWQAISNPRIQIAIRQVTDQLANALAEQTKIKEVYYKATTTEKKLLVPQRDEIDSIVIRMQTLSERLAKFDQLMSQLHQATHLTLDVDVKWPDGSLSANQQIFSMSLPGFDER